MTLIREVDARRALKSGLLANPAPRQTFPLPDSKVSKDLSLSLGLVGDQGDAAAKSYAGPPSQSEYTCRSKRSDVQRKKLPDHSIGV